MRRMAGGRSDPLRRRASWPRVLLFVLVASGTAIVFRQGLVPPAVNPLPLIDLAKPRPWLVDWRLASIKNYPEVCARTLKAPNIEAQPIADSPIKNGCGWHNGVRLVSAAGVRAGFDKLTCETAVALALWLQNEVQPFGQRISRPEREVDPELRQLFLPQHHRQRALAECAQSACHRQRCRYRRLHPGRRTVDQHPRPVAGRNFRGSLPARSAPGRMPILPGRLESRLQRRTPRSLPLRSRPAFALQVTNGSAI